MVEIAKIYGGDFLIAVAKDTQKEDEVTVRVYIRGGCTHAIKTSAARGAEILTMVKENE